MKKFLYLLPMLLLSFTSCERDGDDDSGYTRGALNYTTCSTNQVFSGLEKTNLQTLPVTDIPVATRSYMAAEHPDTEVVGAESFQLETGTTFYEIMTDADVIFIFDANENFICGYE